MKSYYIYMMEITDKDLINNDSLCYSIIPTLFLLLGT